MQSYNSNSSPLLPAHPGNSFATRPMGGPTLQWMRPNYAVPPAGPMFNGAFGTGPAPLTNQSINHYRPPQHSNWIRPDLPPATPFSLGGSSPFNGPMLVDERYRFHATPASFGGGPESRVFDENFPNGTFNFCLRKNGWMTARLSYHSILLWVLDCSKISQLRQRQEF